MLKFLYTITYPTTIDGLSNPTAGELLENAVAGLDHDVQHSNANDAIEALEAKVGVNSSAVTTSHDYKLSEVTDKAVGKTATQTLTNKTLTSPILNLSSNATGDIYYRKSDGTLDRLPIGTAGNIIDVSAGGVPEWAANPNGISGIISPYAGATAPIGWLLCDGTAVSRTTYSALFAVCSTTYGAGDASTTFNLPDLRGRVAVGKSADTEFDVLGETGGEKTHVLSVTELASHTHDHNAILASATGSQTTITGAGVDASSTAQTGVGVQTGSAGSNTAHNNLQPYITINYIIKY